MVLIVTIDPGEHRKKNNKSLMKKNYTLTKSQLLFVTLLRMAIGWHFLYEGIVKVLQSGWSSASYLLHARWLLSEFFHWIANHPPAIKVVDFLNMWALIVFGLCLMLGLLTRVSAFGGMGLLLLYYIANPSLPGPEFHSASSEGSYLIINKNLVELLALSVFALFPFGSTLGLDPLLKDFYRTRRRRNAPEAPGKKHEDDAENESRRKMLYALAGLPSLAAFAFFMKKKTDTGIHLVTGPTTIAKPGIHYNLIDSTPDLMGRLGPHRLSRLILGSDHFGGWAHARDLAGMNRLYRQYHTDRKIIDTLYTARMSGINALCLASPLLRYIEAYNRLYDKRFLLMASAAINTDDWQTDIDRCLDHGAELVCIDPYVADRLVYHEKVFVLAKALDYIHSKAIPAGVGCFSIRVVEKMQAQRIDCDFFVKSFHPDDYWSAHPVENRKEFEIALKAKSGDHAFYHDNMFDLFPERTRAIMSRVNVPWIAFKTSAAGAVPVHRGFEFAFRNGAEFVMADLFDFEVEESVNKAVEILKSQNIV